MNNLLTTTHRTRISSLPPEAALRAWQDIFAATPHFPPPVLGTTGVGLMEVIENWKMDHRHVVLPLCRDGSREAVQALECLIGKPLTRLGISAPRASQKRVVQLREKPTDERVVTFVAANPKKPGSASHERFARYEVGHTVDECITRGVTRGDISWDLERGFIRL